MAAEDEAVAIALLLRRTHSDQAAVFIAEQIGRLAIEGDAAGIARWKAIAAVWQELEQSTVQ